jgi:hypothetical protein
MPKIAPALPKLLTWFRFPSPAPLSREPERNALVVGGDLTLAAPPYQLVELPGSLLGRQTIVRGRNNVALSPPVLLRLGLGDADKNK